LLNRILVVPYKSLSWQNRISHPSKGRAKRLGVTEAVANCKVVLDASAIE
jgi:hypothetical protein